MASPSDVQLYLQTREVFSDSEMGRWAARVAAESFSLLEHLETPGFFRDEDSRMDEIRSVLLDAALFADRVEMQSRHQAAEEERAREARMLAEIRAEWERLPEPQRDERILIRDIDIALAEEFERGRGGWEGL